MARLRLAEWVAMTAAFTLAVFMFALDWYGGSHLRDGWQALPVLRWLLLGNVAIVLMTVLAQARSRGPALSAALDVVSLLLTSIALLLLIVRLATTGASLCAGAFLGVAAMLAMLVGVFAALRTEQAWRPGPDRLVEVVALPAPDDSGS